MKPDDPSDPQEEVPVDPGAKKTYVKPAFEHERVFETMALACGKISSVSVQCKNNRKNS